ncbi:metallophosphoesterase [Aestuariimicrobium kwangyangense]|uniref:metallophosphoesterase n=1 Tax=Aestuariimicrobium kwangyangense TaxID=396389 RepID=UPI0003B3E09B|nr:metallophosphoesterase [Aestuariimicrobium kwangyangense]
MRLATTAAVAAASGLATGAGVLAWANAETRRFTLREFSAPVLPPGAASVRVLHLSDIHLVPSQRAKLDWLSGLASLEPDLVVNTGDNIASPSAIAPLLRAWGGLLDVPGVFVFGSNDYQAPSFKNPLRYLGLPALRPAPDPVELPWRDLRAAMTERGWVDLSNRAATLEVAGRPIRFRGTDDAHLERDKYAEVAGAVSDGTLTMGVTHAPYRRVLDAMVADGVQLVLAGHTHGGQVCLPTGALVTNCDLDTDRVKGLSRYSAGRHSAWLHVSAGLGTSPFAPYRTFCRPEATLLTLTARQPA